MLGLLMSEYKVVPSKIDIRDEDHIREILDDEYEIVQTRDYGDISVLSDYILYVRKNREGLIPNILCNEEQRFDMEYAGILLGPVIVLAGEMTPLEEKYIGIVKLALTKKLLLNTYRG